MPKKKIWLFISCLLLGAFGLFWFSSRPNPDGSPQWLPIVGFVNRGASRPNLNDSPLLLISTGKSTRVESIAFSPDGKKLAIGLSLWTRSGKNRGLKSGVQVRDAQTGSLLQTLPIQTLGYGPSIDFSPDGKTLAVGAGKIKLWNMQTERLKSFSTGSPQGYWVIYAPDGKILATNSTDNPEGDVKLWDALTGNLLQTLRGHTKRAVSAAFSPDGRTLVTASYDNTVKVWEVNTGSLKRTLMGRPRHMMHCVAFAADGKTVASGDGLEIRLWDADTGLLLKTLTPANRVFSVAFSPNGKMVANAGPYFRRIKGDGRGPHGELLVPREHISAGEIQLWDTKAGKSLQTFRSGHWALDTVFAPNGKRLAQISDDDTIRIWAIK